MEILIILTKTNSVQIFKMYLQVDSGGTVGSWNVKYFNTGQVLKYLYLHIRKSVLNAIMI